ncbi:TRAP transporter small permease [Sneathiella limimaris]|uniref:TRAP transporter small permease n=1 Tax=Sneathiella limimaris TaxID=1964213 RepID=UPI00146ACEBE|nr:TRAP transporter small permease [Sneathiella limimaris]
MFKIVDLISKAFAVLGMCVLMFMMIFITVSVCGRYFFNASLPDDVVIMQALLVVVVFIPFAFVQYQKEHLAVTILTDVMPPKGQYLCELLGLFVGIAFMAIVTVSSYGDAMMAFEDDAVFDGLLDVPSWPARASVTVGTGLLTLKLITDLIKALMEGPSSVQKSHYPDH